MANMESVLPDGASITRPPYFNGENFSFWKMRFKNFVNAQDFDLWEVFVDGDHIPQSTNAEGQPVPKPRSQYSDGDKKLVTLNKKAILLLQSALCQKEYYRVCTLETAKEMWDSLAVAHEGTDGIKDNRVSSLLAEYNIIHMRQDETIAEFELRYTHLINQLAALGTTFDQGTQVRKILQILNRKYEVKAITIQEVKGESMRSVAALFGSLAEFDSREKVKAQLEELDSRKKKSVALPAVKEDTEDEGDEELDDEEMGMFVKKFKKFYKKPFLKNKSFQKGDSSKKKESKDPIICFECGKPGHIKADCFTLKNKEKKKAKFGKKKKKAFVSAIWGSDSSDDEEDSEGEEEVANLCLVAQEAESTEVTDSEPSFEELQNAYNELHLEFIKIAKELVASKKKIKLLESQQCQKCPEFEKKNLELSKTLEGYSRSSPMGMRSRL